MPPAGDVVVLMASDVRNSQRLQYLGETLASIAHQTVLPNMVVLGISAAEGMYNDVRQLVTGVLTALDSRGCTMKVRLSKTSQSQFQHYRAVLPYLASRDAQDTWLMFSDDDDLWHPERYKSYSEAVHFAPADVKAMRSSVYAINTQPLPAGMPPDNSMLKIVDERANRHVFEDVGPGNYWDITCRLEIWQQYFRQVPASELQGVYADVDFALYLFPGPTKRARDCESGGGMLQLMEAFEHNLRISTLALVRPSSASNWMYLWRQDHNDNPQHTERQKALLSPIVRAALDETFSTTETQRLYVDHLAHFYLSMIPTDKLPENIAWALTLAENEEQRFDVMRTVVLQINAGRTPSMVHSYLGDLIQREGRIELHRVGLRNGQDLEALINTCEAKRLRPGDNHSLLFPHEAETLQQYAALTSEAGYQGLMARQVSDHQEEFLTAYERARLQQLSEHNYMHQEVSTQFITLAFRKAIQQHGFYPRGASATAP